MYSIVTRARTRRLSILDTDSRPGTPQLDTAAERGTASPRPTRRTRLNSTTLDGRSTPNRSTRASMARGETPEPITPLSNVKRTARTPAKATKSVKKQLTLQEETAEEIEVKEVDEPKKSKANQTPSAEKRVTRSMSQTPPGVSRSNNNTPQPDLNVSAEDKQKVLVEVQKNESRVKEKPQSPTPSKLMVRLEKLTNVNNTPEKESEKDQPLIVAEDIKVEKITPLKKVEESKASPEVLDSIPDSPEAEKKADQILNSSIKTSPEVLDSIPDSPEAEKKADQNLNSSIKTSPEVLDLIPDSPEAEKKADKILNSSIKTGSPTKSVEEIRESPELNKKPEETLKSSETPKKSEDLGSSKTNQELEIQEQAPPLKTGSPKKNDSFEEAVFLDAEDSPANPKIASPVKEVETQAQHDQSETVIINEVDSSPERPKIEEFVFAPGRISHLDEPEPMDVDEPMTDDEDEVELIISRSPLAKITDDLRLKDLTPGIKSRVIGSPQAKQKKTVGFKGDSDDTEVDKLRFPKTPGRDKMPLNRTLTAKPETPLNTALMKGRNSSTPIIKVHESDLSISEVELHPAPLKIDSIRSLEELEPKKQDEIVEPAKATPKKIFKVKDLESEEDSEEDSRCDFVNDEVEEADENYQSGDSMDSSERREIEENKIPSEGESLGSQDTDEHTDEEQEDDLDFIVSDADEEEEDVEPLCFSTNEEDEESLEADVKTKRSKKRRRIVVVESSEDEQQLEDQDQEVQKSKLKSQSNCSSDASKLSEAAQLLNASEDKSLISETELERSRQVALSELNQSERFNKTASRLDPGFLEVESTDPEDEQEGVELVQEDRAPKKSHSKGNRSVHEVVDSDEVQEPVADEADEKDEPATKKPSKSADEEAVLAELASSDLRHLETMFNPLQKSRRQSLYMPSPELGGKEPKLRRRSDRIQAPGDFCPSQSFVEMVAERKRQRNKRKRLSKSLSGAPEDLEELGMHHERKRLKSAHDDSTEPLEENSDSAVVDEENNATNDDASEAGATDGELSEGEVPNKTSVEKKSPKISQTELHSEESVESNEPPSTSLESTKSKEKPVTANKQQLPVKKYKSTEFYEKYCETILQAANEAMLKQKKQQVSSGKKQNKQKRTVPEAGSKSVPIVAQASATPAPTEVREAAPKPVPVPKKDVKRLQAARQAIGHAVNLLAPGSVAGKEPRSLARKLSPQPPVQAKKAVKKQKPAKIPSPVKSSDEENHGRKVNRIRTNAGYVTVSEESPRTTPTFELINTRSGVVRVEPSTPKQKYFRELPATPKNLHGFREESNPSGHVKKKAKQQANKAAESARSNPALQSALRFKEQVFKGRKF
ncbi:hypothetical protein KR009_010138 [Drosophila setifemur]|nr:hypothetical protein KR009_010138 [Drosophila setifemur]